MKIIAEYVTATIQGGSPETRQRLFDLTAFLRVNLKLDMRSPEHWYLTTLARTRHNPGAGATVLQALHVLADKECASIRLRAGDPWKRRNADLIRYYEQFGLYRARIGDTRRKVGKRYEQNASIGVAAHMKTLDKLRPGTC